MTKNAIERSQARDEAALSRRRSGTQRIQREDPREEAPPTLPSSRPEPWAAEADQDVVPTQPENESPTSTAETILPPPSIRQPLPLELPAAVHDETRDTIPSPPPDHE